MLREAFNYHSFFGGDGATALVPGRFKDATERELSALRTISQDQFGLILRVGMVSVDELNAHGFPVTVGKYMLSGNYPLAIFRGGALTKAEELIKGAEQTYEVPHHPNSETNLTQLSCRWKPLTAKNGTVISLLLLDPQGRPTVYSEFLQQLESVLAGDIEQFNPVNTAAMNYRTATQMLKHDVKCQQSFFARVLRMLDTILATALFRWGLFKVIPRLRNYVENVPAHSDFRKFDDMLRMILDCSPEQAESIRTECERMRSTHGICFGMIQSESAIMTCYVPSFSDGSHIPLCRWKRWRLRTRSEATQSSAKGPSPGRPHHVMTDQSIC